MIAPVGRLALVRLSKMAIFGGVCCVEEKWWDRETARVRPEMEAPIMAIDWGGLIEAMVNGGGKLDS
jgi:hypothetical protein